MASQNQCPIKRPFLAPVSTQGLNRPKGKLRVHPHTERHSADMGFACQPDSLQPRNSQAYYLSGNSSFQYDKHHNSNGTDDRQASYVLTRDVRTQIPQGWRSGAIWDEHCSPAFHGPTMSLHSQPCAATDLFLPNQRWSFKAWWS